MGRPDWPRAQETFAISVVLGTAIMQPIEPSVAGRSRKTRPPMHASRVARLATRAPSAFTLTELLVVISIIALLAALTTAAVVNAMRKARQSSIQMELQQISQAIETFESESGVYPPNLMHPGSGTDIANRVEADLRKTLKKLFPRHQEPPQLIAALAGTLDSGAPNELPGGLNAAEALYFWMGGFSDDPKYPISGPGGPSFNLADNRGEVIEDRNRPDVFDVTRLGPRDDNGVFDFNTGRSIQYEVNTNNGVEQRQINFWTYTPRGSEQPLVYFDVSRYKPYEYDMYASSDPSNPVEIHAIEKLREGITAANTAEDLVFVNQDKFQILHAGLDEDWGQEKFAALSLFETLGQGGSVTDVITYPEGPFVGALADTLTNFTTGTLEDAQE